MSALKFALLVTLVVSGGCGGRILSTSPPLDGGTSDSSPAEVAVDSMFDVDARNDGGLRPDGCPADPSSLSGRCTDITSVCPYLDGCANPPFNEAFVMRCVQGGPGPTDMAWQRIPTPCSSYKDARGCPLGTPGIQACTTPGLDCFYYPAQCELDSRAVVLHSRCSGSSGGSRWVPQPNLTCSELDAGI